MKLVNYDGETHGRITGVFERTLGDVRLPFLQKEPKAQDVVINILTKVLDNSFFILCDVPLVGLEEPFPSVLVGPQGIWMIYPISSRGICRAEGEAWEVMDEHLQRYRPGKPNYMALASTMAQSLEEYLSDLGFENPEIEPVLVFTNPGVHVEFSRPSVRIVLIDALERFAVGLVQNQVQLNPGQVQRIVDSLTYVIEGDIEKAQPAEILDAYSLRELPVPRKPIRLPQMPDAAREEPEIIRKVSQRTPFTKRQWMLLGFLLVGNIIILIVLVLVVMTSF